MDRLTCFAGVDWGSETHQVCIVERDGAVSAERSFRDGGAGLAEMQTGSWPGPARRRRRSGSPSRCRTGRWLRP